MHWFLYTVKASLRNFSKGENGKNVSAHLNLLTSDALGIVWTDLCEEDAQIQMFVDQPYLTSICAAVGPAVVCSTLSGPVHRRREVELAGFPGGRPAA